MVRREGKRACAVAIGALLLLACSTPMAVDAEQSGSANFSALRSYTWGGGQAPGAAYVRDVTDEDIDRWVRAAVDTELAKAGYEKRSQGADFLIRYDLTVENRRRQQQIVRDRAGVSQSVSVRYREGTLVLEVLPPAGELPLWRGWAETEVHRYLKPEDREARIGEAVKRILARFPRQ